LPYTSPWEDWPARVTDQSRRVRLEASRARAEFRRARARLGIGGREDQHAARAAEIALTALDKPMDRVLDYALWLTVRELEPDWMPEFKAGKLTFGGDAKKLAFALNALGTKDAVKPVVALIESGKVP